MTEPLRALPQTSPAATDADQLALVLRDETAPALVPSLPSVVDIQAKLAWMSAMRPLMLEFLQKHMDPARHFYTFERNRYTPLTPGKLKELLAVGQAPALNQSGMHNLLSLYECYAAPPQIVESREDGHYTCRVTLELISGRSGRPMSSGVGSCSTREGKYAYRWVYERDLPRGIDKTALKLRRFTDDRGREQIRYRLDNEDLADLEPTVLKMAVKRAKSAAVQALPLASELFASIGDPDEGEEEQRAPESERPQFLAQVGTWLRSLQPASVRLRALEALTGRPMTPAEVQQASEDQLAQMCRMLDLTQAAGINWSSPTLTQDLRAMLRASAAQAHRDLYDSEGQDAADVAQDRERQGSAPATSAAPAGTDAAPRTAPLGEEQLRNALRVASTEVTDPWLAEEASMAAEDPGSTHAMLEAMHRQVLEAIQGQAPEEAPEAP